MIPSHLKGKAKEQDFDDLDPAITYRHVLQQNLGVRDPLRVVALCDSDAFYAACEMVRLGVSDKPLVVLQWEGIIAVNYHARKFGITRFHKLKDAKERCPELMIVHVATYKEGEAEPGYWDNVDSRTHKVSLDYYRRESAKILKMFREGLPGAEIEKASIDEAFIDFTRPVRQVLLQRYPYLAQIPLDAPNGADSPLPKPPPIDWCTDTHLVPAQLASDALPEIEEDGKGVRTWHDIALDIAAEMMLKVRADITSKLGYTTSAGIARNKFLAKLCASYRKPNSQTILRNHAIPCYLRPLEFQKIRFLGGKLGEALAKEYDVSTVADMLSVPLEELQAKFGENSLWVYELMRGIDRSEVKEKPAVNKSMMAAKNLPKPITKAEDGPHWIRVLAAELALRLKESRIANPNLWPKTLVLHACESWEQARSKQAPFPFNKDITVDLIATAGGKLWKELVGNAGPTKIRHVSLAFTGIELAEEGQQSIEGFFSNSLGIKRLRENEDDPSHRRRSERNVVSPRRDAPGLSTSRSFDPSEADSSRNATSFTCSQCNKTLTLSAKLLSLSPSVEEKAGALTAMKNEHNDFHFAQSIAREVEPDMAAQRVRSPSRRPPDSKLKKSRKRKEGDSKPKGIAQFFSAK